MVRTIASATLRDLRGTRTAKLHTELDLLSELHILMDECESSKNATGRR